MKQYETKKKLKATFELFQLKQRSKKYMIQQSAPVDEVV